MRSSQLNQQQHSPHDNINTRDMRVGMEENELNRKFKIWQKKAKNRNYVSILKNLSKTQAHSNVDSKIIYLTWTGDKHSPYVHSLPFETYQFSNYGSLRFEISLNT